MKDKKKVGHPTKFQEKFIKEAQVLSGFGLTDGNLATYFEVDPASIVHWKNKHPRFLNAIKKGKVTTLISMTKALYNAGLGGNVTAMFFYLVNRYPDLWQSINRVIISSEKEEKIADMSKEEIKKLFNAIPK